ncbi:efflux transporter outer membrane subunit [Legionella fallonii]|uniref:NodT family efflux transporter n=1 Tax=Legionella fallonii LLAP-10 TaxID=1212491 RepID=A0A098G9Q6_9GAMM|nr:efflux transporter outer membrane subunit [Legionella fallonii]CEG58730.1 NodT family efflux transporter [Legionella fallonii LLAP-10]
MNRSALAWASLLVNFLLLNSCKVGPNYTRPAINIPQNYTPQTTQPTVATKTKLGNAQHFQTNKQIAAQWWELFHSKPLNDLVIASFKHNPNVGVAQEALRGALENISIQQGAFYPAVGASFAPTKQQIATILTSALASNQNNYYLFTGQVFVSYTIDVFGGIRRQVESSVAQAELQRYQLEATYLTLAANVINAAIQEAALREQIKVTKQIINSQEKILAIMHKQYKLGDTSLANVALQEAALATSKSTLLPLEKQLAFQRDLLNALTGRFPDDKRTPEFTFNSLHLPTELPIALPSTLLEHRPDIRAAEEQMKAANALIGVAAANRLPNISLTSASSAGTAAASLVNLLQTDTLFWSLAGIITQPVFQGGILLHKQRAAEAAYKQTVEQYKLTVINAFQNVTDTLKAIRLDAEALNVASQTEQATLRSLNISRRQFQVGDVSILTLLTNEQMYEQAQLTLIQAQTNRLSDAVALFQALGGSWWNNSIHSGAMNQK